MSEHNPYSGNYRSWRVGIPMMLLEYPAHPELCHRSMAIVDSYLMNLTGNILDIDGLQGLNNLKTLSFNQINISGLNNKILIKKLKVLVAHQFVIIRI
jgi:hypothetical protein